MSGAFSKISLSGLGSENSVSPAFLTALSISFNSRRIEFPILAYKSCKRFLVNWLEDFPFP